MTQPASKRLITEAAAAAQYVPRWKPNTAYTAGASVIAPDGGTVTAKADFTSGATYSAAGWNQGSLTLSGTPSMQVLKSSTDTRPGVFEWIHDSPTGYLFHLMNGVNSNAPLIGMGIDNAGTGIFLNNKKTGKGISIQQNDTITSPTAYGFYASQLSKTAPLMHIDQADGAKHSIRIVTSETANDYVEAVEVITPGSGGGYISSRTGKILWKSDIVARQGARLRAQQSLTGDGNLVSVNPDHVRFATWNGAPGGYWQKRINQNGQTLSIDLADGTSGGPETAPSTWFTAIAAKQANGLATGTQLGFFGAAPVSKPSLLPADATDLATAMALLNYIKNSVIKPLGLAA